MPHGIAKKALLTQLRAHRKQYGFNSTYLMPVNPYEPRDDFDLKTSHVILAVLRKCIETRERGRDSITAWGTGEPTREFLYVEGAAEGILNLTERYDDSDPVNLGSGIEISIRELVETIAGVTGFNGEVEWDTSKPDGQMRRLLDVPRVKAQFGWEATTGFDVGLQKAVKWFENNEVDI